MAWLVSLFFLITLLIESWFFKKPETFPFWTQRNWARIILFLLGFWVKRNKRPQVDTFLFMPNHQSYLDILVAAAYSPSVFVSKAEVLKWPIFGTALKASRSITVQRDDMKSLLGTMKKIQQSIENKLSITIFPEGTTSKGKELLPFKNGTFKIAAELNINILPCAIRYKNNAYCWVSKESFVHHFLHQLWRPVAFIEVRFGTPITHSDFAALRDNTKSQIENMLAEMDRNDRQRTRRSTRA